MKALWYYQTAVTALLKPPDLQACRTDKPRLELKGTDAYVYAPSEGVFEPFHALGSKVEVGQPAGRVHRIWEPATKPELVHYGCTGTLYARRQPGRVKPGNCCLVVASPA